MRSVDANTLKALGGSRAGESLSVWVWYNGRLAHPEPLQVASAGFSWDRTRQVQTLDLAVADQDGVLAPWLLEDPLGVGGSRLQVRHNVGGAGFIGQGWYRIRRSAPQERWRSYIIDNAGQVNIDSPIPAGKKQVLIPGGALIRLQADDLGLVLKLDRLLAPESPPGASPTVFSEITRLAAGSGIAVSFLPGAVDRAVSKSLIYERDRLDAIQALCKSIGCDYRMDENGILQVYPLGPQTPVAVLRGGDEGMLVEVDREQDIENLYNMFVVDGTASDRPVRGIASITGGPLAVGGPHGRVPTFYESSLIETQAQADAYAVTMRDTHLAGLVVDLKVTCLPIPHLQQGDWVTVANPIVNGQQISLNGMLTAINQPWSGTVPGRCTAIVSCTYADVQSALGGVFRG